MIFNSEITVKRNVCVLAKIPLLQIYFPMVTLSSNSILNPEQYIQFRRRCCTYCFYARPTGNHVLQARDYGISQKDQFARLKERIVETRRSSNIMRNQIVNHDPSLHNLLLARSIG